MTSKRGMGLAQRLVSRETRKNNFSMTCPRTNNISSILSKSNSLDDTKEPDTRPQIEISRNTASHSHRKAFVKWVTARGKLYEASPRDPGTNYLDGKAYPFPLNPAFQPLAPLSPETKNLICEDWSIGMGLRQLSQKWGISLERAEAILKLQQLQTQWEQMLRMTSYSDVMHKMLGSPPPPHKSNMANLDYEPKSNIRIEPSKQIFTLIPESADYTPEDAAVELGKIPFAKKKEVTVEKFLAQSAFEREPIIHKLSSESEDKEDFIIEAGQNIPSKFTMRIKDSSSPGVLYIRNRDGVLSKRMLQTQKADAATKWYTK